jgi:hypothetical protein
MREGNNKKSEGGKEGRRKERIREREGKEKRGHLYRFAVILLLILECVEGDCCWHHLNCVFRFVFLVIFCVV